MNYITTKEKVQFKYKSSKSDKNILITTKSTRKLIEISDIYDNI